MESFLVTGSSGFIGSHLVKALQSRKIPFQSFDKRNNQDVTRPKDFDSLKPSTHVVHLAGFTSTPESFKDPELVMKVNLHGTKNVLDYCRKHDSHIIFASSYVYGNPEYLPVDEKHPLIADSPYKATKLMAEESCRDYHDMYGLKTTIFRQFNIYGPGQNKSMLIPTIISQLDKKEIILQDPEPKRDFLYVSDLIDAYFSAAKNQKLRFEIFNVGYGKSYSVKEVVGLILKLSKKNPKVTFTGVRRQNEIMDSVADIAKIKNLLAWKPKISIEEGLKMILSE